jgi:hypothetical protein
MIFKQLLILIALLLIVGHAKAGGWISSGGENFHDGKNPWFLKGETIRYCILHSDNDFSMSETEVEHSLETALKYWQSEFSKKINSFGKKINFDLGSNILLKTSGDCKGDEDLRVIFGYSELNSQEKNYLGKDYKKYLGVTVRTDYETTWLRGKGFIYIAGDKGTNQYDAKEDIIKNAWEHKELLAWALIHELGHVFGIPHMGNSFMSEIFMDLLVSKYYYQDFKKLGYESFLSSPEKTQGCTYLPPESYNYFELDLKVSCLRGQWKSVKQFDIYAVYNDGKEELVAQALGLNLDLKGIRSRPVSYLKLTSEQKVFSASEINHRSLVPGPFQERVSKKGKMVILKSLKTYPVHMEVSPESITIISEVNNKLETVFSYNSSVTSALGQMLEIMP